MNTTAQTEGAETTARRFKRLSINLPEGIYRELQDLANESNQSMSSLLRNAFALAQLYYTETAQGKRLVLMQDGEPVKEILIPR